MGSVHCGVLDETAVDWTPSLYSEVALISWPVLGWSGGPQHTHLAPSFFVPPSPQETPLIPLSNRALLHLHVLYPQRDDANCAQTMLTQGSIKNTVNRCCTRRGAASLTLAAPHSGAAMPATGRWRALLVAALHTQQGLQHTVAQHTA